MKFSVIVVTLVIAVCIFSLMISFQHGKHRSGCSLDGSDIECLYEVVIIQKDRFPRSFASVLSARIWFCENDEQVCSVLVTDEATGEKIKAQDAFFVVSDVVTTLYTGNTIHVFAEKTRARSHARQFNGKLIENPFQVKERKPVLLSNYRPDPLNGSNIFSLSCQNPLFLPARNIFIKEQDSFFLPREYPTRPSGGYSNPPDKPPRAML
ncbi:MAG: hypothetical protein SWO11_17240 [Thermodesulfobacteriota bacterium]|nr:hypothetical protein [Thermodesulfobacteriota bacterium]